LFSLERFACECLVQIETATIALSERGLRLV